MRATVLPFTIVLLWILLCGDTRADSENERGGRIVAKTLAGALGGSVLAVAGGTVGYQIDKCEDDDGFLCGLRGTAIGGAAGYAVGVAASVSLIDPNDRFTNVLAGSVLGFGAGIGLTAINWKLWPSILVCPLGLAVMASEKFRTDPMLSPGMSYLRDGKAVWSMSFRF